MIVGHERTTAPGLRWWIIALVFLATFINFIDRLTISVLGPVISEQLGLTNTQFARITICFLIAYTISQGLSGKLYDRIGTRRGFTLSILVWSLAAMGHAFARGLTSLCSLRVVLGLGEAGNWPGAAKVIAEWFPARERGLAMGIFNSGVSVGSVVATPLIVWLQLRFGWKATFLVTGSLGLLWLALWLLFYDSPEKHRAISREEYELIKDGQPVSDSYAPRIPWRALLGYRQVWAIVLARFLADPTWWLFITWLPKYLADVRHFSLKEIGTFAWLPFLTADAGSLLGGWASGFFISRGWSVNAARKTVIVVGMLFMLGGIPAAVARDAISAMAFICLVTFGFQAWINNVQTLPSDYFPDRAVASVAGLGGVGAGIGAILFTLATGLVVDALHSYTPILVIAGLLPVLGTVVLFALAGRVRSLSFQPQAEPAVICSPAAAGAS